MKRPGVTLIALVLGAAVALMQLPGPAQAQAQTQTQAQAQALAQSAQFAQRRTLSLPSGEGLHALQLDEDVYRAAQTADLRDMRLYNAAGEALPWMRLPAPPPPLPAPVVVPMVVLPAEVRSRDDLLNDFRLRIEKNGPRAMIELTPVPAGGSTTTAGPTRSGGVLLDLRTMKGERGQLMLKFVPGAPDFAGRVDLLGSDDLVDWRVVAGGPLVTNRQLGAPVERNVFALPAAPAFLRVQPAVPADAPGPQFGGATFTGVATAVEPARSTLAVAVDAPGVFLVDVPVGLPTARVHVRPPRDNMAVRARVLRYEDDPALPRARLSLHARRAPERWVPVALIDVFRLDRNGVLVENPPLTLPARTTALRIELLDGAGFGGDAPVVQAGWQPERIAFAARGPGPYTLAVGLADAKPGPLLAAAVLPADDPVGARLPRAQLDPLAPAIAAGTATGTNAGGVPGASGTAARATSAPRLLLWGLLLGAVVMLGAMAWQLGRQLRRGPQAPSDRSGGDR